MHVGDLQQTNEIIMPYYQKQQIKMEGFILLLYNLRNLVIK